MTLDPVQIVCEVPPAPEGLLGTYTVAVSVPGQGTRTRYGFSYVLDQFPRALYHSNTSFLLCSSPKACACTAACLTAIQPSVGTDASSCSYFPSQSA